MKTRTPAIGVAAELAVVISITNTNTSTNTHKHQHNSPADNMSKSDIQRVPDLYRMVADRDELPTSALFFCLLCASLQ